MDKTRIDLSRTRLVEAFYFALGSYMEQEATKGDEWTEQSLGQLYAHLKHEVEVEIRRNIKNNDMTYLLHNAVDAVSLSVILLATVMEMANLKHTLEELSDGSLEDYGLPPDAGQRRM